MQSVLSTAAQKLIVTFFGLSTAFTSSTKVSGTIAMDLIIHLTLFAYVRLELEERVPSQAPCSSSVHIADCGARSCHAQWLTRGPSVSAVLSRHLPNLQPHCHRLPIWKCLVFLLPSHLAPVCAAVSHSLESWVIPFLGRVASGVHMKRRWAIPFKLGVLARAAPGSHLQKRCASHGFNFWVTPLATSKKDSAPAEGPLQATFGGSGSTA